MVKVAPVIVAAGAVAAMETIPAVIRRQWIHFMASSYGPFGLMGWPGGTPAWFTDLRRGEIGEGAGGGGRNPGVQRRSDIDPAARG